MPLVILVMVGAWHFLFFYRGAPHKLIDWLNNREKEKNMKGILVL